MGSPRAMPSKEKIAQYWNKSLEICWRCRSVPARLERAHIIDRWVMGDEAQVLDCVENLWMLCGACHSVQPGFDVDEYNFGLAWMNLDARGYVELYMGRSHPALMELKAENPELYEQTGFWIAMALQEKWDAGNTNANFSSIL